MKRIALASLLFGAVALSGACEKKNEEAGEAEPGEAAAKTAAGEEPAEGGAEAPAEDPEGEKEPADALATFESCWSAFDDKDEETFADCYAGGFEFVVVDGVPPTKATSREQLLASVKHFWRGFPDLSREAQLVLVNGRQVAAVTLLEGKNEGPIYGAEPTGESLSILRAQLATLNEEGKVTRDLHWSDQATMLHQLGIHEGQLVPPEEEPWDEKVEVVAEDSEAERENVETVKQAHALFNQGDAAELAARYAGGATFRYVPEGQTYEGREAIQEGLGEYFALSAELESTIQEIWAAGDWVVVETLNEGTLSEEVPFYEHAESKEWSGRYLELFEMDGGEIAQHWIFANSLKFAADLGLFDPDALGGAGGGEGGAVEGEKAMQKKAGGGR